MCKNLSIYTKCKTFPWGGCVVSAQAQCRTIPLHRRGIVRPYLYKVRGGSITLIAWQFFVSLREIIFLVFGGFHTTQF